MSWLKGKMKNVAAAFSLRQHREPPRYLNDGKLIRIF
jgi:hypothetical protein